MAGTMVLLLNELDRTGLLFPPGAGLLYVPGHYRHPVEVVQNAILCTTSYKGATRGPSEAPLTLQEILCLAEYDRGEILHAHQCSATLRFTRLPVNHLRIRYLQPSSDTFFYSDECYRPGSIPSLLSVLAPDCDGTHDGGVDHLYDPAVSPGAHGLGR